ncbi:LPS-assembly protein LptD [Sphingomicrobium nitratireducens]|uniref:LPS-assembly protein LptD n=1 Tax=Sphingomicrobium nitratireducens TaxID=2964666 RepID=UPI0030B8DAE3
MPAHALAQEAPPPLAADDIEFSADTVAYDAEQDIVTATGRVRMNRDGYYLAADEVVWNRITGEVSAKGNVVAVGPSGDRVIGDTVLLTEDLRTGSVDNLLLALESGGRLAARTASRVAGQLVLENTVYSPCPLTDAGGCPKNPSWKITAARVSRNEEDGSLRFEGGRLHLFGISLPLLPVFNVGDPTRLGGATGALVPDISISGINGVELAFPYYWRIAPNRDFTLTPHVFTESLPALEGRFRHLGEVGAFQAGAFVTYGDIDNPDPDAPNKTLKESIRGYFEANGRYQFDPWWRATGSMRLATDKTVTRRYDITRDDRLRNFVMAERIGVNSYVSIAGWAFQGLRVNDEQDEIPVALPAIDARLRLADPVLGGRIELQANSLAILRADGQDTQRAFAGARWDNRYLTSMGQELTLTAYGRADAYHTDESAKTATAIYRGEDGWHFRGLGALAADLRWPLIGEAFGGTQRFIPRVQLVVSPPTPNLVIPNEDARAIDLEDSNLFALNRFPGYDRWEDGSRITYGMEWMLDRPNMSIRSVIGQSFRLSRAPDILPDGTGLTDKFSDIVGRTRFRFGRMIDFTHRFRVDKDNLAIRRNEVDLTVGTTETYAQIGYLRLNRNIDPAVEDLRDKEELRLAGRVKFARYYSVFGATVLDLTGKDEDPLSLADGFEPARHRIGVSYEDDCLELGLSWKRDYERIGDFRKGSTFAIQFRLKGLGR